MNALPLNALPRQPLQLVVEPITNIAIAAKWLSHMVEQGYEIVHYIRHQATIELLRSFGAPLAPQPNAGLYQYADGDVLVIVTLRQPQRGAEVQVRPEDLEVWEVRVRPIA